jgi:MoxR-like ATPase
VREKLDQLNQRLTATVLGAEVPAQLLLVALLSNGHVLIQGAPGVGKTTLAKTLAGCIDGTFSRIQFTPDLLPADILGYSIYHQGSGQFQFTPGPVFRNIVLADEINRASPRIQSALLECMNEHQVTVDGVTRNLEAPFLVVATQNNLYSSGTFPLPEPQLDRFLLSITMTMPDVETQTTLLQLHAKRAKNPVPLAPILHADDVRAMQEEVSQVQVNERVCRYIANVCEEIRKQEASRGGPSARASIAIMRAAQAMAYLTGSSAVHPDHVKAVAGPVMSHRIPSRDARQNQSLDPDQLIAHVLQQLPVP